MEQDQLTILSCHYACWQNYTVIYIQLDQLLLFRLHPASDSYPLALLPIGNKPLISYQIEYLERNGINKIFIPIEKKHLSKLETFFAKYFRPDQLSEIELIAL
jgi:hypothetical protein